MVNSPSSLRQVTMVNSPSSLTIVSDDGEFTVITQVKFVTMMNSPLSLPHSRDDEFTAVTQMFCKHVHACTLDIFTSTIVASDCHNVQLATGLSSITQHAFGR